MELELELMRLLLWDDAKGMGTSGEGSLSAITGATAVTGRGIGGGN